MFKIICFFVCLFLLFSCSTASLEKIQMIDDCEYIVSSNSYGDIASHKGDCKNVIHKCNAVVIHDTIYVVAK